MAIVVLALVLGETFVESQYYFQQNDVARPDTRSQYYFYDDQQFFPANFGEEEARTFPVVSDPVPQFQRRVRRAASNSEEDVSVPLRQALEFLRLISMPNKLGHCHIIPLPSG